MSKKGFRSSNWFPSWNSRSLHKTRRRINFNRKIHCKEKKKRRISGRTIVNYTTTAWSPNGHLHTHVRVSEPEFKSQLKMMNLNWAPKNKKRKKIAPKKVIFITPERNHHNFPSLGTQTTIFQLLDTQHGRVFFFYLRLVRSLSFDSFFYLSFRLLL